MRRGRTVAPAVAVALLAYVFLWDNSSSLSTAEGYAWTRLVELPRQARFAEFAAVGGLLVLAASRRLSRLSGTLLGGCIVFGALSWASYLMHPLVGLTDFLRLVYMYMLPILVFVIARELPWRPSGLARIAGLVMLWILVSAAVSWAQYLYFGYEPGDDITGLNQDAHVNAAMFIVGTFLLLAQGLFLGRHRRVLLAVALSGTAVLPSALTTLFLAPFLVGLLLRYYFRGQQRGAGQRLNKRLVVSLAVAAVIVVVTGAGFLRIDFRSSERIPQLVDRVMTEFFSFGPFVAHGRAVDLVLQQTSSIVVGLGPYSYSNPISMGQRREGGELARFSRYDLDAGVTESGADALVTLTSSLMVEFGIPAFVVLTFLYGLILVRVHRCTRSSHPLIRLYSAAVTPGLLLLLATGVLAQFGSITSLSLSWSLMILAGAVVHLDVGHRNLQHRPAIHAGGR